MSVKPCKFFDIRSGSPVLIGDYEAALEFLVKNPDVMEGKAPEAKPATKEAKSPTAKNYVEARDQIAEGAELTKEEVEEELPYFLSQMGLGPLNEKTKNNKAKELFEGLVNLSQEELLDTDSSIAPKIAKWVESVQSESGIKPMSLADRIKAYTAAQRNELKGTATSGGVLYKALLDAIDSAVDAAVKAKATAKEINAAIKKAIEDFRTQYQTNQKADAEKAIAYLQKGAPTSVKKQIEGKNEPTKRQLQKAIDKAFAVGMGYGKQAGFQKGATEGGRAGFIAGKEVGVEVGQQSGIKEGKLAAAKTMKAILSGLKAELKPSQINGLLDRFAKIKNFSEESKQRFMDYAFNVIDDANYVLQERAAEKVKNRIAKLSNSGTITANDASLFKQFSGLSVGKMTPETLNEFIDWGNKILGKSLQKGDRDAILEWTNTEKDRQDAITAERSAKMKAGRERNLQEEFDRLESEGDLPDGVTTFEEFKEFKKPKSKAETSEQKVEKVSQALSEIDLSEIEDDDNRAIIEALKGLDLSILNAEQLEFTANALNSFIDTGVIYGLGDIAAKAQVWNKIAELKAAGIKFKRKVDPSDAKKLSLTHIFTKFLDVNANAAKLRAAFIQPWLSKSSSAFEDYVKAESALLKMAKKLGVKQENWNRIDLFGFLNEAEGNPELFDNLLEQKKSDLEMLKESVANNKGDDSMSAKSEAERLEALKKAMSLIKDATTLEQVKANLTPYELSMYDAARAELDKFAPKAIKNMQAYGNTEVGYIKNYWPRTAKKFGVGEQKVKGELEDFSIYGNDDKLGKNAFGRQKGRSQLLGKNGYYDPIGQINLFNGLRETMMVANAGHEYHQMQAVYNNTKGFDQLVSGDGARTLKELFVDYITDTKNHGRFALDQRGFIKKAWDGLMNNLTSALIKNPTQLFRQPTALAYPALTAPEATGKASVIAAKLLTEAFSKQDGPYTKAFKEFSKNSTLALRLNIPEIIELSQQYVGDQWVTTEYFTKATKAINDLAGGEAITIGDKATSIIATLAGYIQHKIDVGEIKSASDFDFLKEMSEGIDMDAMSAGEQMQGKTNNENSRLLFSEEQKANATAYFLSNFTRQAVQNLYINFRKAINPTSTSTERREALSAMAGYAMMAISFQVATSATTAIVNQIAENMAGDDDDEEKLAAIKAYEEARALGRRDGQILQELMSVGVGTQNILVQTAVNYSLAEGFMAAQKLAKEYEGELPEIVKKRLEKEYAPLYSNETVGQVGVAAEAFITPLIRTVRADDRKKQASQDAVVLGLKIANMGAVAYGVNKYYQAQKRIDRALKESGTKGEKQIEAKLNPNKEAEEKIKGKIESAINTSDSKALSESFNALMKTSKKTRYQTARDNIFDKIVDDKIRPKSIPEDEASRWIKYIMKGEFADKTVGKGKVKLSELVPANERQEYIKRYMKQAAEVNEKLELMDKALPEAINGKWKDQVFKNAAWRKFVGQKPIKRDVIVEKPVEGGLFRKIKGLIK